MTENFKTPEDISSQGNSTNWEKIKYLFLTHEEQEEAEEEWIAWERGKKTLEKGKEFSPIDYPSDGQNWIQLASEMYEFDPKRFNEEIEIPDSIREEHFEVLNNWFADLNEIVEGERNIDEKNLFSLVYSFLGRAAPLKKLYPEEFAQNISMGDKLWEKIAEVLEKKRDWIPVFMRMYENALSIDEQKTAKYIPISESYWGKIIRAKDEDEWDLWKYAVAEKRIKPKGYPEITFPQEEWTEMRKHLTNILLQERINKDSFRYMSAFKSYRNKNCNLDALETINGLPSELKVIAEKFMYDEEFAFSPELALEQARAQETIENLSPELKAVAEEYHYLPPEMALEQAKAQEAINNLPPELKAVAENLYENFRGFLPIIALREAKAQETFNNLPPELKAVAKKWINPFPGFALQRIKEAIDNLPSELKAVAEKDMEVGDEKIPKEALKAVIKDLKMMR